MATTENAAQRARRPTPGRKATYTSATRLARLVFGLRDRPYGWSFSAIEDELSIGERTLLRYLSACRRELTDRRGRPVIEVVKRGSQRLLRFANGRQVVDANPYEVLFLYFALSVFQFLDGTVIKQGVEDLCQAKSGDDGAFGTNPVPRERNVPIVRPSPHLLRGSMLRPFGAGPSGCLPTLLLLDYTEAGGDS